MPTPNRKIDKKIGIDIMGVILPKYVETGTFEELMSCPALPGAIESIKKLVMSYQAENIFIISKCPKSAEKATIQWFDSCSFFTKTGFQRKNIYFCREQADKAQIARSLQLSCFVDDKVTVLNFMNGVVPFRIQLAVDSGPESSPNNGIVNLYDWPSVVSLIASII